MRSPLRLSLLVVVIGLLATAALSAGAWVVNEHNEDHLLNLQVESVGAVLSSAEPNIETQLTSAAELAAATKGDPARFDRLAIDDVGRGKSFVSMTLWRLGRPAPVLLAHVGSAPLLRAALRPEVLVPPVRRVFTTMRVVGPLQSGAVRRLGYAVTAPSGSGVFTVYAEGALGPRHSPPVAKGSPFADLNYALYLGKRPTNSDLLESSSAVTPIPGTTATTGVAFGNTTLFITASAIAPLSGWLSSNLFWLIIALGVLLTGGAGLMTNRIVAERRLAEVVAKENEELYAEQRSVAVMLQHALLPEELPDYEGAEIGVRYLPGSEGVEIGGDWYDIIDLGGKLLFVVGDVSGHGLVAATTMASLRFGIRAYAALGDDPASIFAKLSDLVSVSRDGRFATVLCATIDLAAHEITFCNAGHPLPILMNGEAPQFIETPIGPPVGVTVHRPYPSKTITVPAGATLLAYTDGLIERHGESLDEGASRLLRVVTANASRPLEELLDDILAEVTPQGSPDDIALMGLRWRE